MTPREYFTLWDAYIDANHIKRPGGATIDALP